MIGYLLAVLSAFSGFIGLWGNLLDPGAAFD